MTYNLTNFTSADNLAEQFIAVNTASNNWLSYLLVLGVFIVMIVSLLKNNPVQESFFASSTVSLILSLLFLMGGLTNIEWVIGWTVLWAASMIALYKSG